MGLFTHWWEFAIVLLIILLIFGAGKLPDVGKSFGKSIKEFKQEIGNDTKPGDKLEAKTVETIQPTQTVVSNSIANSVITDDPEVLVKRTTRTLEDGSQEVVEERVVRRKVS